MNRSVADLSQAEMEQLQVGPSRPLQVLEDHEERVASGDHREEKRRVFGLTKTGRMVIFDAKGKRFSLKIRGRPIGRPVPGPRGCLITSEDGRLSLVWKKVLWERDLGQPATAAPVLPIVRTPSTSPL